MNKRTIAGWFFILLVYCHQVHFDGPTPASRLDLLHAICTRGSLEINDLDKPTPDKAKVNGKFYSDKAPGMAVAALPGFALGWFGGGWLHLNEQSRWLLASWLACASTSAVVVAIGAALLWESLAGWVGPRWALITISAIVLGSAPLPYSTILFSHALVFGLLCVVFWAVLPPPDRDKMTATLASRFYVAGFCAGWALASEYSSGLVVVGLGLYLLAERGWPDTRRFLLAAIPPILLIPWYSWATIGSPFQLPYTYQASFPAMREGVYAIQWPDLETAGHLLFSPERGLLFWSPLFAMALFGYRVLMRRSPKLLLLTYLAPALQIIIISGRVWDWSAGPTYGPRLLTPVLPMLALPCALGIRRFPFLAIALALYSVSITTLATLTDAFPDFGSHPFPLVELQLPDFLNGSLSPTLPTTIGLNPHLSAVIFWMLVIAGLKWLLRESQAERSQNKTKLFANAQPFQYQK